MKNKFFLAILLILTFVFSATAAELKNNRYQLSLLGNDVEVSVEGTASQVLRPEFTVMYSGANPGYGRNHTNYFISHRESMLWPNVSKDIEFMNEWINSADMKKVHGFAKVEISEDKDGNRKWAYLDEKGVVRARVEGGYANGTSNPFFAGERFTVRAVSAKIVGDSIVWSFEEHPYFSLSAKLTLDKADGDPGIFYSFKAKKSGYYSAAFTGAPQIEAGSTVPVPQQAAGRNWRQFNHLVSEGYLKLPRAHISTGKMNYAIAVDPCESPFRLVNLANSRFGMMIARENDKLKPMAFAPIMGGPESKMEAGKTYKFKIRYVQRAGDWKDTYRYIARNIYNFRDMRDNSGPGSLNSTIENIVDYCIDRDGHNYAMWHAEQKYYNYWSDKSGVFKPFSPIFGLTAAIITDDERFYRERALPAVEFAVSRKNNVFSPYDLFDNGQVKSRNRDLGWPYVSNIELVSLYNMFARHTYAFKYYAEGKGFGKSALEVIAEHELSGEELPESFGQRFSLGDYMDMLETYEATKNKKYLESAVEGAYYRCAKHNLFPMVPDKKITLEKDNKVPVHGHSYGRHLRWGFPPPDNIYEPQQTVPAWRASLIGVESIAYRGEYWMNNHAALMRIATYADDDFLRDMARWGVVGRFANYAGDNRSNHSLIAEYPDAPLNYIYGVNFSTFNPGHAWEFNGAMIDFLLADAFHRSEKKIDFPACSMSGAGFRTRAYGAGTGVFYDEKNVRLWLPRKLVKSSNKQVDYLAGYGKGKFYIAFWNQSFNDEQITATFDCNLVDFSGVHKARFWENNLDKGILEVSNNKISFNVKAKGIVAYAIDDVEVKTKLQKKMLDESAIDLGPESLKTIDAPFGKVHAMLISIGKGLTSAFFYTDALPENVIEAKLRYRQGGGKWTEVSDEIFPYEVSTYVDEDGGDFECSIEIENADQQIQKSELITLKF